MVPRELLATASVPGGAELRLFQRGGDFAITLDDNELMSSRMGGSEEALAVMACDRLKPGPALHLLVGGYGMGFTLRAALARLPPEARITLVELVPEVIAWARGPMAALTAGCLEDARVSVIVGDVGAQIGGTRQKYDAILLDVDNGPEGLTRVANDHLYSQAGLARAKAALKPGGVLAIWSATQSTVFSRRLKACGLAVEEVSVRGSRTGKGPRHVIWFAKR